MDQLDFFPALEGGKNPAGPPPPLQRRYRIADIPIVKPKPYQPDPWEVAGVSFEDVNWSEEKARIENQGKKTM